MGWTFYNSSGQQLRNTGTVLATQAEMEAGSALTSFVTPGRTQYHPGVAKVWCLWEQNGAHGIRGSRNVASVTDGGGAGDTDILWATDFSGNETYALISNSQQDQMMGVHLDSQVAGGCTLLTASSAGTNIDNDTPGVNTVGFGDQ